MVVRTCSLVPFPGEGDPPDLAITGIIRRGARRLFVEYALRGELSELKIPTPNERPARKDRLWEATCLELFLGEEDSERYWEFNLSPSGDWNVYRFTAFREGMQEEQAFSRLPFRVRIDPRILQLSLELDVGKIIPAASGIEASISAVIESENGFRSHWALCHPGLRPDFHRRDGFRLKIPGS